MAPTGHQLSIRGPECKQHVLRWRDAAGNANRDSQLWKEPGNLFGRRLFDLNAIKELRVSNAAQC